MMRLMLSLIDQTADLYGAMQIPSIQVEDAVLPKDNRPSSPDSISITAGSGVRMKKRSGSPRRDSTTTTVASWKRRPSLTGSSGALPGEHVAAQYSFGVIAGQLKRYEESRVAFERLLRLLENRES